MKDDNATGPRQPPRGWKRMFLDDEGNPSSMRVMAAIAFLASAYLAVVEVFYKKALETGGGSDTELVFYFLAAAFVPKALQKFAEGASAGDDAVKPSPHSDRMSRYGLVELKAGERGTLVPRVRYDQVRLDVALTTGPREVA